MNEIFQMPKNADRLLAKKRTQNVQKDKDDDSDDDVKVSKRKTGNNESSISRRKKKETHFVKFGGEEYSNTQAKGDKLIKGKYEPFAYIQLNPKTTSNRGRKEELKLFSKIM